MPTGLHRAIAALCYLGALRVPVVAFLLPGWAFTLPSGLLIAGAAWAYGRRKSPFLLQHGREGLRWSVQSNLLLAAIALISKGFYYAHALWRVSAFDALWHLAADSARWAGLLVSVITVLVMVKAVRGATGDAFTVPQ